MARRSSTGSAATTSGLCASSASSPRRYPSRARPHVPRRPSTPSKRDKRERRKTQMYTNTDVKDLCIRSVHIMADGTFEDFEAVVHPEARNREDVDEPPASRGRGPAAFYATALWLRDAYADFRHDIHDVVVEGDLVAMHATMSGRQT